MRPLPLNRNTRTPDNAALNDTDFDALFNRRFNAPEEQLAPSSGFVVSVMDKVHQQASEPSPLGFPWRRAVPGLLAVVASFLAFFLYAWNERGVSQAVNQHLTPALPGFSPVGLVLCWSACALCLSIAIAAAAFRFTNHDSW